MAKVTEIQKRDKMNEESSHISSDYLSFLPAHTCIGTKHGRYPYDLIHVLVPDFESLQHLFPKIVAAKVILDYHDIVRRFTRASLGQQDSLAFQALK